jgi:single-strand DNA-binding protein
MDNLNSILVEGTIIDDPFCQALPDGRITASFKLESRRTSKNSDGSVGPERFVFEVLTYGKLAEVCGEYLKKGRGVRVVGSLWQTNRIFIRAEHVEFKPVAAKAVKA